MFTLEVFHDIGDGAGLGVSKREREALNKFIEMTLLSLYNIATRDSDGGPFFGFGGLNIKNFFKSKTLTGTLGMLGFLGGMDPDERGIESR